MTLLTGWWGEQKAHTKLWVPTHPEMQRGHSYSPPGPPSPRWSLLPLVPPGPPSPRWSLLPLVPPGPPNPRWSLLPLVPPGPPSPP